MSDSLYPEDKWSNNIKFQRHKKGNNNGIVVLDESYGEFCRIIVEVELDNKINTAAITVMIDFSMNETFILNDGNFLDTYLGMKKDLEEFIDSDCYIDDPEFKEYFLNKWRKK